MADPISWQQLTASTGMLPRENFANLWPEFADTLDELYSKRVAQLPFVPLTWLSTVRAYRAAGTMLLPISSKIPSGARREGMPTWLDDSAAAVAWDKLSIEINAAFMAFINGERLRGQAEIAALQRNAAFWDALYTGAVVIRDLPGKAVGAVLDGAQQVAGSVAKSLFSSVLTWVVIGGLSLFFGWRVGLIKIPKGK